MDLPNGWQALEVAQEVPLAVQWAARVPGAAEHDQVLVSAIAFAALIEPVQMQGLVARIASAGREEIDQRREVLMDGSRSSEFSVNMGNDSVAVPETVALAWRSDSAVALMCAQRPGATTTDAADSCETIIASLIYARSGSARTSDLQIVEQGPWSISLPTSCAIDRTEPNVAQCRSTAAPFDLRFQLAASTLGAAPTFFHAVIDSLRNEPGIGGVTTSDIDRRGPEARVVVHYNRAEPAVSLHSIFRVLNTSTRSFVLSCGYEGVHSSPERAEQLCAQVFDTFHGL